jgi:hypothetical protein
VLSLQTLFRKHCYFISLLQNTDGRLAARYTVKFDGTFFHAQFLIALMMKAVSYSETLDNIYLTIRRNIPEDSHLHIRAVVRTVRFVYFNAFRQVKLECKFFPARKLHAGTTDTKVQVKFHTFLTWVLVEGEWSAPRSHRFTLERKPTLLIEEKNV